MKITKEWLEKHNACNDGADWARENKLIGKTAKHILNKMDRADWFIWLGHEARLFNRCQIVWLSTVVAEWSYKKYWKPKSDKRVWSAILAARDNAENDTEATRSAAESAESASWSAESAAWSAGSAESAAASAAWSAESASWSAESAAGSAGSAESAAWSARSAGSAESAAHKELCALMLAETQTDKFKGLGKSEGESGEGNDG